MNRVYFVLLGLVLLISGCQNTSDFESNRQQLESISTENESLKTELESVKKERDNAQQKADEFEATINTMKNEKEDQDDDVTVIVIKNEIVHNPKEEYEDLQYNYWPMTCYVKNNTDKDIQSVQGKIKVIDLFGTELLTMACDFNDKTIPTNESAVFYITLELNDFINEKVKYYVTDSQNLKFEFQLESITFTDGSTNN